MRDIYDAIVAKKIDQNSFLLGGKNMKKITYICDHCKKELYPMTDLIDIKLDIDCGLEFATDLCTTCFEALEKKVVKFLNREE